jgi:hypothetical protein
MTQLLRPKPTPIKTQDDGEKVFVLSKFPAVAGREIVTKYPLSNMPKLGEYAVSEETMLKLMAFVGVDMGGGNIVTLSTRAMVDNHVPDFECLMRLEWSMLEYNVSFFAQGLNSDFFANIRAKAPAWISRMWTDLLAQSSQVAKQPSEN